MPALPSGTIALWYGSVASIPAGFILCNGGGGSPDLRDRFIIGAAGAHAPGAFGGAVQHTHSFTSDGHFHVLPPGALIAIPGTRGQLTTTEVDTGDTDNTNHLPPYHALVFIMKT